MRKALERSEVIDNLDNRFLDIMRAKKEYKGDYPLIDLGVGEDKERPSNRLLRALKRNLRRKENHKYSDLGIDEFKLASIEYLKRKHIDVDMDEILPIMGAKSILAILPLLYLSPGDIFLTLRPSYVVSEKIAKFLGAEVRHVDIDSNNPDKALKSIKEEVWKKIKVLNLNFPHNPTGSIIKKSTYQYLIRKAKKHNFLIINDATYIDVNYQEVSCLFNEFEAKDVGLEIFSLSKAYNMTGFRLGFIIGSKERIRLISKFKDCFDSGQYIPLQYAGIEAMKNKKINESLLKKYQTRLTKLYEIFSNAGLKVVLPKATFYLYIKVPSVYKSAKEFALYLLNNLGIVTLPYDDYGSFIRVSATIEGRKELYIYKELEKRLKNLNLI